MGKSRSNFAVVCKVQGELAAQAIKAHLESEGIPVILQHESLGAVYGLTVDGLGQVKILVPKPLLEEAKQVIQPSK